MKDSVQLETPRKLLSIPQLLWLNRFIWVVAIAAWLVIVVFAASTGRLHLQPGAFALLALSVLGVMYVLTKGSGWHRPLGIIVNTAALILLAAELRRGWDQVSLLDLAMTSVSISLLLAAPLVVLISGKIPANIASRSVR